MVVPYERLYRTQPSHHAGDIYRLHHLQHALILHIFYWRYCLRDPLRIVRGGEQVLNHLERQVMHAQR